MRDELDVLILQMKSCNERVVEYEDNEANMNGTIESLESQLSDENKANKSLELQLSDKKKRASRYKRKFSEQ